MSSEEASGSDKPNFYLVHSNKPPEEVRIFGLRGADIQDVRAPTEEEPPAEPDDWGITGPNEDGVCKYCQLMLHPEAPKVTLHQPNLQTLVDSTCPACGWLEVSIVRGSPRLVTRYQQGDPVLCNPSSTAAPVTVSVSRAPKYTRLVATVGRRDPFFADIGVPVISTTAARLGELASQRFWVQYGTHSLPHERLLTLKKWLSECSNHEDCQLSHLATGDTVLPTRVLDLTGSADVPSSPDDIIIKLRETSENETGQYTTLSYCWGADPKHHFITTKQNLDEHKRGIDFSSLPLTQRETILATLILGVRYIWIDSLCIVQDSAEDWQIEAAKMRSVYSNSLLTLAATSAKSPEDGLLNPFQAAKCVSVHGETVMIRFETHETIDKASEPLNTRGWTLQEAVLSPRVVCFGSEQWLWKCPSRYATEDGLIDRPQLAQESLNQWAGIARQGSGDDGNNYFRHWYRLVSNYSKRALTFQSDKLKAIAGLADTFARHTGYQYVAGLWVEDLATGLMWTSTSRGVARDAGSIPTWSWISVEGEVIALGFPRASAPKIELLNVEQQWEGVPLSSNLKAARLTVKGPMIQATLGKRSMTQMLRFHLNPAPGSEEILGEVFLDNTMPIEEEVSTIWCLFVHSVKDTAEEQEHFVLVLVPVSGETASDGIKTYRRIGIAVIWNKSRMSDGEGKGNDTFAGASEASVVLV